ncbi:MAG: glycoside hydrolase family 2 TIM barrel-domain containing protein [Acidobacteriota bacterium]
MRALDLLVFAFLSTPLAQGASDPPVAQTETLYLSGRGPEDAKPWSFTIDAGRRAGEEATIAVPGHWEQQGFGTYAYGRVDDKPAEVGTYGTTFEVPADWQGRSLRLVFGGVMTDAEVRLNGEYVGEHRGGFTEFAFDVTEQARDGTNELRVVVSEASSDRSINRAERDADYWTFGGIYRPVWIEASPPRHLTHVAIDARHDGAIEVLYEAAAADGCRVESEVLYHGRTVLVLEASFTNDRARARGTASDVDAWTAETAQLYDLRSRLICGETALHERGDRFGFRTVEVRPGKGLFINERRVVLKGINRHSFWPDTGRALTERQNRYDARLLKTLHINAVRASHYPPDRAFLDACDELGLYVLDELPGWQDAYGTEAGTPLVRELVRRDVNHPSVIAWNNGNEDGWNTKLDPLFHQHDPQQRPVLHPRGRFGGFETEHYANWEELQELIDEDTDLLLMPTEYLHALYDGGGGASLFDYWRAMERTPRFAGAFLWALLDEAVLRSDTGELDAWTNFAPDGIVGPYRELEPSASTVQRLFAPVRFERTSPGRLRILNGHTHVDLDRATLFWEWIATEGTDRGSLLGEGSNELPSAAPGDAVEIDLPQPPRPDALLRLKVRVGALIAGQQSWPPPLSARDRATDQAAEPNTASARTATGEVVLESGPHRAVFDSATGALRSLHRGDQRLELPSPPLPLAVDPDEPTRAPRLLGTTTETRSGRAIVRFGFEGAVRTATWILEPEGELRAHLLLVTDQPQEVVGLRLLPATTDLRGVEWLGAGPTPIWRNRREGPDWGLWSSSPALDERARGFFGPFRWARLTTSAGEFIIGSSSEQTSFGVGTPTIPEDSMEAVAVTASGVTVLSHISAIGTKFHPPKDLGPSGAASAPAGLHRLQFTLRLPQEQGATAEDVP